MRRYVNEQRVPGRFLTACLSDSASGALRHSDKEGWRTFRAVMSFIQIYVPEEAWGSPEKVARWEDHGIEEKEEPQGTVTLDEARALGSPRKRFPFPRRLPSVLAPVLFMISGAIGCTCCELPWDHGGELRGEHHHELIRPVS